MNLMMLLEMAGASFGDRVAVQCEGESLTFAELFGAAGAAAAEIAATGAENAAVLDVSSLAMPVALFGSAWAGVPFVPLNYRLTGNELDRLVEQITPSYLVTEAARLPVLEGRSGTHAVARESFLAKSRAGGRHGSEWSMDPEEIAVLLFTSGTTGPPKAAVLRHKHLVSYIYSGRRIVQLPNFDAERWLELARTEKITNAFVVPTMLARIVDVLEGQGAADLPHLRALSYGGGKMPLPVIERAMRLFPDTDFTNAYGLTETSSTLTVLGPEDHRAAASSDDASVRRRLASVGRVLPSVEIEIRDDEGRTLGAGERGEIHVRGEQVSGEYKGQGSRVLEDGFFPTRDGGWLDEDGFLFLEGRVDDIIVRGGENMSPGEIEDVLLQHPAVADCAVVGVPDEQWGEAVAAVIVARGGEQVSPQALRDFVKGQLRSSRTPERIEFCDELPYNETGKLLRRRVRADLLGEAS
jgi:acyl-CoA synthetase (AMP-forming)/AMP-acid ligase II